MYHLVSGAFRLMNATVVVTNYIIPYLVDTSIRLTG